MKKLKIMLLIYLSLGWISCSKKVTVSDLKSNTEAKDSTSQALSSGASVAPCDDPKALQEKINQQQAQIEAQLSGAQAKSNQQKEKSQDKNGSDSGQNSAADSNLLLGGEQNVGCSMTAPSSQTEATSSVTH